MKVIIIILGLFAALNTVTACKKTKTTIKKLSSENDLKDNIVVPGEEIDSGKSSDQTTSSSQSKDQISLTDTTTPLIWKRYRAFERGLMSALDLSSTELCTELGTFPCIDKVHLTVLGGNEPYDSAQYERAETPTALTPAAVERVVLSACSTRASIDKQASNEARVFKQFSLNGSSANNTEVSQLVVDLYRRFLARDPNPEEVSVGQQASSMFPNNETLAVALCFAIGTNIENIFL